MPSSPSKLVKVVGGNFSGRTTYLRQKSEFQPGGATSNAGNQYLGSDVANYLSGVARTVLDEIQLHAGADALCNALWINEALDELQLRGTLSQNPFSLSGGEQTLLTILTLLSLGSRAVALDCALEQLSAQNRMRVFSLMQRLAPLQEILIADNRMNEFPPHDDCPRIELSQRHIKSVVDPGHYDPYLHQPKEIDIEGLAFRYPTGRSIFSDASLAIEPGRAYLLTGENGAGKSTFSKLLCGLLRSDAGVFMANQMEFKPHRYPSEYFAYHFQNPDLQLFSRTVIDEVRLSARTKGDDRIISLLRAFGLDMLHHKHPMDLPFSLRKRLAIAVTIAMERPWIILDEPTIGQDDATIKAIADIIKAQARAGTGILVISHSRDFLGLFNDGYIEVRDGKLFSQVSREQKSVCVMPP